jgi:hypothetical protein
MSALRRGYVLRKKWMNYYTERTSCGCSVRELLGYVKGTEAQNTSIGVLPGGVGRIKFVV